MNSKLKGISLIVLVITIIVIIILAGGVILALSASNPINSANEAVFKSDLDVFESDLSLYLASQYSTVRTFNPNNLNADDLTAEYNDTVIVGKTIKDIIPALSATNKYNGQFEVVNGKLVYVGTDRTKKKWAQETNIEVIDADRLDAIISTATTLPISAGTNVVATLKISSNASINNIKLTSNLELLDQNNVSVPVQPVFEIGVPSGTQLDTLRTVDVTIKTDTLAEGIYKLKLKPYSISNIYDVTIETDIVTGDLFEIDNTPPTNPEMSAIPTGWTNLDVVVTITYPSDSVTKEYSSDGTTWNIYTDPVVVSTNSTTIYARATDIAENQSCQSTMTIANIDRESPTVVYGTNGGNNLQVASTKVTVTDVGVSNVDTTSLKYIWDTQSIDEPAGQWNTFVNDEVINKANSNGTYYLWIKASDNTGNNIITKSNAFIADNTAPENPVMSANPTVWTNENVTVTITYPVDSAVKEYSTNGTSWNLYTSGVVATTNNTTVYARATDASGNQSGQSTITVANIDKVMPTATYVTNGGTNLQTASTVVTASDVGGSNIATLEYIWDTQNTSTPSSGWTAFTSGSVITKSGINGTYYLWVRVIDNAGNSFVTKSNAFVADNTPPVNPTMSASPTGWTNGNVTVTITYPSDAAIKEYSTNAATWNAYTSAVVVTTNNTTVYARARDASGNQSGQSTLTITNIDKSVPSVPVANFNGYTPGTWTKNTIVLNLSSTDNASGINKYQWSGDGVNWNDFYSSWTYNYDTVQAPSFRSVDNAGNVSGSTPYYAIYRDSTAPTYTSYTITNVSSTGYDIYVYGITDNYSGINRVQFPTTSPSSGWIWNNGTNLGNGTWYYRVNNTDYNNESGQYQTHIYIYDNVGNQNAFATSGANVTIPYTASNPAGTESNPGTPKGVNSTINGQLPTYNNPVIPAGFMPVNTTDANWNNVSTDWNNGLVIQDSYGNQFVWVPVDGTNVKYAKWCTAGVSYASTTDDTLPNGFSVSNITDIYKGFYIARFEPMFEYNGGNIRAASKKSGNKVTTIWSSKRNSGYNGCLWNWINYTDAKAYSENMATAYGYNTSLIGTNLITGAQWDTTLKWIQNSGKSVTDSRAWGNHNNSMSPANVLGYGSLQISGYSDYWKTKNIYDLAGNAIEWTSEKYSSNFVMRGGYYFTSGNSTFSLDNRTYETNSTLYDFLSFRLALYIK